MAERAAETALGNVNNARQMLDILAADLFDDPLTIPDVEWSNHLEATVRAIVQRVRLAAEQLEADARAAR